MNSKTIPWIIAALMVSSGASAKIKSGVMAAGVFGQELCVVENARVEAKFRDLMLRIIHARGYQTRIVATTADCPVTMTFTATYARTRWGTVSVLKTSRFMVYRDAKDIAEVTYSYSHGMFGNGTVEEVVTAMIEKLLPSGK